MNQQTIILSLVIPVYNEATGLNEFIQKLFINMDSCHIAYELIVIDDGSLDHTWAIIQHIAKTHKTCHGIRFTRNFGKEAAIYAGLEKARGQAVIVMDGDGQHPIDLIPDMLNAWQQDYLMVIANKKARPFDSLFQRLSSKGFNYLMLKLTGLNLKNSTDFRLLDRQIVDALLACPERIRFFRGMTEWLGYKSKIIDFDVPQRLAGHSRWRKPELFALALQAIAAYSAKPLFYLFSLGVLGIFIAMLLTVQALYSWLTGIAVSGWTSITILLLFFGSANMLGIGALGIYIAQIFDEIKQRPRYLVAEITEYPDKN